MSFSECQEQKERVKACYGDWFQKLWGGSWDQSDCEQETYEYRQCVQDVMKRRKEQGKRKLERNVDNDWMDEVKDKSNEMANDAKSRARKARNRAREEKDEAKSKAKSTASDMSSKVQETADSWTDTIKGYARKANDKVLGSDDDD